MPQTIIDPNDPNVSYTVRSQQELDDLAAQFTATQAAEGLKVQQRQIRKDAVDALIDNHIASDPTLSAKQATLDQSAQALGVDLSENAMVSP